MIKINTYEDFKNFKINVPQFMKDYNANANVKLMPKKTLANKKKIQLSLFIYAFMKDLRNDYIRKSNRKISGGTGTSGSAIVDLQASTHQANANNFFYWFPRQADYTNVNSYSDMSWNKWAYPITTNFVRGNY